MFRLIFLSFLCFVSCTTLLDDADNLYEKGLYKQALSIYDNHLIAKPDDEQALVGRQKSRQAIVNHGLIEVRMLRLAGNYEEACQKFEAILESESRWQIKYDSAMAFSQEEEVKKLSPFVIGKIRESIDKHFPMKARFYMQKFVLLLASSGAQRLDSESKVKLQNIGIKSCKALVSELNSHSIMSYDFFASYCRYWGQEENLRLRLVEDNIHIGSIKIKDTIVYKGEVEGKLEDVIRRVLKKHPYYRSGSKKSLKIFLQGSAKYKYKKTNKPAYAHYFVEQENKVLLESSRNFKKDKDLSMHDLRDYDDRSSIDVTTINSKEKKSHFYVKTKHKQTLALSLHARFFLQGQEELIDKFYNKTHNSWSQIEHFPAAMLYPKAAELIDHNVKFQEVYMSLAEDVAEKLSANWRQRFCRHTPSGQATEMESVQRCAALDPGSSFVNSWYQRKFSVDYSGLHWLLGQNKNR